MAASTSSFLPLSLLLLLLLSVAMETRTLAERDDGQVLRSLFGSHLASVLLEPPTSDDIIEGSADWPTSHAGSDGSLLSHDNRREAVPQLLLDLLRQQVKTRRRSRKSMVGGAGCFGMKMDRIGSISGLGC